MGLGTTADGTAQFVLSRDQHDPAGPFVRSRISRTYRRTAYTLQILTVRDENDALQTLRVTEEHPFFVESVGWTPARSLEAGDRLLGAEGTLAVVSNQHEAHPQGVTVYNLEVEQAHTYFVLAEDATDAGAVWVHNAKKYDDDMIASSRREDWAEIAPEDFEYYGGRSKFEDHHYATNKNRAYTPEMTEIAEGYGLKLDQKWNKEFLPHAGNHPPEYHDFVLDGMRQADIEAAGQGYRM